MRIVQISLCALAILAFLVAAVFVGDVLGDVFGRSGIAVLVVDLVVMQLWPTTAARGTT